MITYYLVLILSTGSVVMPQQYTFTECQAAGVDATANVYVKSFSCVKAPK